MNLNRLICVLLCVLMSLSLFACGDDDAVIDVPQEESTAEPINSGNGSADSSEDAGSSEGLPDEPEAEDVVVDTPFSASRDVDLYKYDTVTEGKFSMLYPAHYTRVPGTKTICFEEPVNDGTIPVRIAFTRKGLSGRVHSDTKTKQLKSYFKRILSGFDSYDMGTLDKKDSFLGDNEAYSVAYTAKKGDKLYKGYVVMAAGEKVLYVFHFRCGEVDYERMKTVMERVRNSITFSK